MHGDLRLAAHDLRGLLGLAIAHARVAHAGSGGEVLGLRAEGP